MLRPVRWGSATGTLQEPVWVNVGGLVTANPFYKQLPGDYPQTATGLPLAHSRPNAPLAIFLDFDGGSFLDGITYPPSEYENIAISTTSLQIGTGSKTFTVPSGLPYNVGDKVRAAVNGWVFGNFMEGTVTSYSAGRLVLNVQLVGGSGTWSEWRIQKVQNNTFNAGERDGILDSWHAAAMWFSLFNVDVTTEAPPMGNTKPIDWVAMTYSGWGLGGGPPPHQTGASPVVGSLPGPNSNIPHEVSHSLGLNHTAKFDSLGIETSEYSNSVSTPIITSLHGDGGEQLRAFAATRSKVEPSCSSGTTSTVSSATRFRVRHRAARSWTSVPPR